VKKNVIFLFLVLFVALIAETSFIINKSWLIKQITPVTKATPKPLLIYTFQNLKKTEFPKNPITFGSVISENKDFISQMFYFSVPKNSRKQ
jgi:membrane-anchored protein YejM (alkaline phosphatase superfamily)